MNKGTQRRCDRIQAEWLYRETPPHHRGRLRHFVLLRGCAILLAFSGCSKTQTGAPTGTGGSPAGGSQGQGGRGGSGGTSTISHGGSSAGGSTGGASNAQSDASASDGAVGSGGMAGASTIASGGAAAGGSTGGTSRADASASGGGGAGGAGGGSGTDAGLADARETSDTAVVVGHPRRVIVCDEGNTRISLLDLEKNTSIWQRPLPGMRDIQLVGNARLGASSAEGYVELDLADGTIKKEVKGYANVQSLRRLPNGNTILGMGTDSSTITLLELDSKDVPVPGHNVTFPTVTHLRLFRRTPQGTFLLGALSTLAEVNWNKEVVWQMTFQGDPLHIYQGMRLPDGTLAVSEGYGSSILIVDPVAKKILTTIGGKSQPDATTINPHFYAGFQILQNGHYVVTNWQNHGAGHGGEGIQLLEYDAAGTQVWKWKQDPNLVSSLHGVIVLDGLDTSKVHDDVNGILAPVTQ